MSQLGFLSSCVTVTQYHCHPCIFFIIISHYTFCLCQTNSFPLFLFRTVSWWFHVHIISVCITSYFSLRPCASLTLCLCDYIPSPPRIYIILHFCYTAFHSTRVPVTLYICLSVTATMCPSYTVFILPCLWQSILPSPVYSCTPRLLSYSISITPFSLPLSLFNLYMYHIVPLSPCGGINLYLCSPEYLSQCICTILCLCHAFFQLFSTCITLCRCFSMSVPTWCLWHRCVCRSLLFCTQNWTSRGI